MTIPISKSVKILLLNEENKLLLMHVEDQRTKSANGAYYGPFWCLIGGRIENSESLLEAATREIYEETGIKAADLDFGPTVWFGTFDFIFNKKLIRNKQTFIVARTQVNDISLDYLTEEEKTVVKDITWLSLDQIKQSKDVVFPVVLPDHLPPILSGDYPAQPFEIDLAKQPDRSFC